MKSKELETLEHNLDSWWISNFTPTLCLYSIFDDLRSFGFLCTWKLLKIDEITCENEISISYNI